MYDDAKDETFIRDDETFIQFYSLNMSNEIVCKRLVRQKLRALSRHGILINHPFTQRETETVRDGNKIETYTSEGEVKEREVPNYSTVSFDCNYTNGTIRVDAENSTYMAAGFKLVMIYRDGQGSAVLPNTKQTHHFRNRAITMGPSHIELRDDMEETPTLCSIFNRVSNLSALVSEIVQEHDSYRQKLIERHLKSNSDLGDGFWYFVFNNPNIQLNALVSYLQEYEGNETIRSLPGCHKAALDFLYSRMKFVSLHATLKLWYVFWDDFFYSNKDMDVVRKYKDDFTPLMSRAVCYHLMDREHLEKWLEERSLLGSPPSLMHPLRPSLFNESNLDALYGRLAKLQSPDLVTLKV